MKISGFTFCRNIIKYDFPAVESILSILPIVDEYIVNVGKSDDETEALIASIRSDKIKIVHSVWNEDLKKDGLILSEQTNIALKECRGDWAFYLQADEVVHEEDLPVLVRSMEQYINNPSILGLTFRYLHFYGDYYSVHPWFYRRAVRIIRNNGRIVSCGDAVGFSNKDTGEFLKPRDKARCPPSGARMYHYGYVKDSRVLLEKIKYQASRYHGDAVPEEQARRLEKDAYDFKEYSILKNFGGSHPKVMRERIGRTGRLGPRRNRWLNWRFYKEVLLHGFKG